MDLFILFIDRNVTRIYLFRVQTEIYDSYFICVQVLWTLHGYLNLFHCLYINFQCFIHLGGFYTFNNLYTFLLMQMHL